MTSNGSIVSSLLVPDPEFSDMRWIRISIETSQECEDALSNLLMEMGSGGVQIDNGESNPDKISVTAYFPPDDMIGERVSKITALLQNLRKMNMEVGNGRVTIESLDEKDWTEHWKDFFKPLPIGERILVHPSWINVETGENASLQRDIVIQIDPEMAFGTGGHSTTILCLEFLESVVKGGEKVADVGVGSGILSIAAVKLGAREVVAIDVDAKAVAIARENVRKNGVSGKIHVICGDGLNVVKGSYDIIVSNISRVASLSMIPDFRSCLNDDGALILSGILGTDVSDIQDELKNSGLLVLETRYHEEWGGLLAKVSG